MNMKNIQTKLLIILLPLVLLILGALSGSSYYLSQQSLAKSIDQTAIAVGTDYGHRVQDDMKLMISKLEDLASIQRVRTGGDKVQLVEALAEAQKRLGVFDAIVFITPEGAGFTNMGTTASYGERDYFKKVIATQKAAVSDPVISKSTGKLAVVLAVPVMNNGNLTGVLVGTFSVERLTAMIKDSKFLDTGYGQITDKTGVVIANPINTEVIGKLSLLEKKINPALKMQQTELDDRLINMVKMTTEAGKQTQGEFVFVDGVPKVAVFTPIDLPGDQRWVMSVAAPKAEAAKETNALAQMMLVVCIVCLIVVVAAIIGIAKWFAKPISMIRDECLLLAQGDLRELEAKISSEDEIGQLAKGFREMRANLRELVGKVHSQSEQLAASSEELTASAEQSSQVASQIAISINEVASGAEKQVHAINETSAVMEHMSAGIQQVAANANLVAEKSSQAAETAKEGGKSVEKAVSQMLQIEQTVNNSAQVVAKLGERSKEIGQIVDTISGIAGQTNLLALNAAIEAARAGEQGRGFAVVAEEVRKLAEQSQDAAKQIAQLIREIQGDTDHAIVAMNAGTQEVAVGAEVVTTAGHAFGQISNLVNEVFNQVKEISAAIQQMAGSSQQMVLSVKEIDRHSKNAAGEAMTVSAATEEQLASTEEIVSSSQNLAQLAQDLQEAINKFYV
ncbi:MAG: methyl-accepting chemotaxis sensory transducer with Cache sensor [Firmicutes bacterium]|nr:methyl-accepting chemotaxis sensory transducer with Cache sensor [Bacillota bacterium]